ncbi:MAG: rod shape-determining protein MreC [Gammaproteobacteria bacterium]|nr:rod shape-determining protein MreC [Gammaproteobacteria bacterium]
MERIYKKSTKEFYTLIILILLSITTIILDHKYERVTYVRSLINDLVVYPIHNISMLPKSFFSNFVTEYQDVEVLENEISELKKENLSLKIKLQELAQLKEENNRLRDIQKKSESIAKKQTIVKVVSNSASPNKKIVVIDKGTNQGIYIGQNVIGINGLIGQVVETNFMSSKVILINDINHNVPGEVNRTGEKVIISGSRDNDQLTINYAPVDTTIEKGDVISTSGIAERFKPKIPIGKVTLIEKDPEKRFSKIEIEAFENLNNLSELILIWDYKPVESKKE